MAAKKGPKMAKKRVSRHATEALHFQRGDNHVVGVNSLRVLLIPDGDSWFAQGLEIDYAACGDTVEEAKANFGRGLHLTICEHIKLHGTIEKLLKVAPSEAWQEFFKAPDKAIKQSYTQISGIKAPKQGSATLVEHDDSTHPLPFDSIAYIEAAAA